MGNASDSPPSQHSFRNEEYRKTCERLIRAGLRPLFRDREIDFCWTVLDDVLSIEFESYEITEIAPDNYSVDIWYTCGNTFYEPPYVGNTTIFFDRKSAIVAIYDAIIHIYSQRAKAALDDENDAISYEEYERHREEFETAAE
jgi:hypothetical protein